jgi:hypothetical protein
MHHIMRLLTGPNADQPFRLQCTCATGGDFSDEAQAVAYKDRHFSRLGGIDDGEYLIGDAPSTYMQAPVQGVRAVAPLPAPQPEHAENETIGDA